jgi:hypothetical protein
MGQKGRCDPTRSTRKWTPSPPLVDFIDIFLIFGDSPRQKPGIARGREGPGGPQRPPVFYIWSASITDGLDHSDDLDHRAMRGDDGDGAIRILG